MEVWKSAPGDGVPVVLQVVRDSTYGQVRHIENLEGVPGIANIVVAPAEARAALPASRFVAAELPRRPSPRTVVLARQLAATIRPMGPAIVHSHSVATLPASFLLARSLGVPLVHSPHALPVPGISGSNVEVQVAIQLIRLAAAAGARFVAVSEGEYATLRRLVGRKAAVDLVLNPVPFRYLAPANSEREPRTILSLSRFWAQKSPELSLDAFAVLRRRVPEARLLWAGDGPLLDDCRVRAEQLGIAGAVEFLGAVPDPLPLLRRASVLLSSSSFEAMPYSILEAMAVGAVVVATDIPAHREITAGNDGLSLTSAQPAALAEALERAVVDTVYADAQRERARLAVQRRHSPAVFAHTMSEFYSRVAARSPGSWLLREAA